VRNECVEIKSDQNKEMSTSLIVDAKKVLYFSDVDTLFDENEGASVIPLNLMLNYERNCNIYGLTRCKRKEEYYSRRMESLGELTVDFSINKRNVLPRFGSNISYCHFYEHFPEHFNF